jgi:hypothetical protein
LATTEDFNLNYQRLSNEKNHLYNNHTSGIDDSWEL